MQVEFTRTDILLRWKGESLYDFCQYMINPFALLYDGYRIEPRSFETDLGSIPDTPFCRWYLPPDEFAPAYVPHDWGYRHPGNKPRSFYDKALRDSIGLLEGGTVIKQNVVYIFVRAFGWYPWNKYRREEEQWGTPA